jgi:putative nucleotidyltransferase with HDIG domain
MAAFIKKKTSRKSKDRGSKLPKKKVRGDVGRKTHFFETSRIVEGGLFFVLSVLVILICFLGQEAKGPQLLLNAPAQARIVAEFPFEYNSTLQLEEKQRVVRAQVPPVFERTIKPYEDFSEAINNLNESIAKTQIDYEELGEDTLKTELEKTAKQFADNSGFGIEPESILNITTTTSPRERSDIFTDALEILKALYEDGIYTTTGASTGEAQITVIQLVDEEGRYNLPDARSQDDALIALRVRINEISSKRETARALFDLFRKGISPNLQYSAKGTDRAIERAIIKIPPVSLAYKEGQTLIEPGIIVTPYEIERLSAYIEAENERGEDSLFFNLLFIERVVLSTILLLTVLIYLKQGLREVQKRNRALLIIAFSILLNLLVIRAIVEIGEIAFVNEGVARKLLPYFAPVALGPILVAVLIGAAPAVLTALIISALFGIMQNNSIDFLLFTFLAGVVGSFVSVNIRTRSKLVRAGFLSGATVSIAAAVLSLIDGYTIAFAGEQTIVALIVGLLTGILAVGLLPIFEQIFKITTEITLLELTDFNHPLLRRMQVEAPGTYHHSLMVANLSENAAAAIGASPLLCRACCFFHDIGKLVKPEYFVENQRGGINPHVEKNPSMSALVIKAHVKEGVELARKYKLPRVIMEVIRQHHGTGLIQYFYYQAQQQLKLENQKETNGKSQDTLKVDESTYRYDGPKPAFKESAIIFFADGLEAASRTLKKVSQPAVEELVDGMFKSRIEDGQLDECPLTFKELDLIRSSFVYTVLNTLHSRIEYPKEEAESKKTTGEKQPAPKDEANTTGSKQPV